MKTVFCLCFIALLFTGCEARLEDDVRAHITLKVLDGSGNPAANIGVTATTYRSFQFFSSQMKNGKFSEPDEDFLLGQGFTDQDGEVSFTALLDGGFFLNLDPDTNDVNVVRVSRQQLGDDLKLDIPEVRLRERAEVEIVFVNNSGSSDQFTANFNLNSIDCPLVYFNGNIVYDNDCTNFYAYNYRFNQSPGDGSFHFSVYAPSDIEVTYWDESGNQFSRTLSVTQLNERYEIQY